MTEVGTNLVAILLAAGSGSRFGGDGHKLHAEIGGRTVFSWALQAVVAAQIGPVIVVTGAVELEIDDQDVTIAHNSNWNNGIASSLQVGISAAGKFNADSIVVGLGDQPFVVTSAWRAVAHSPSPIAVATYQSQRGNPVKLDAQIWPSLPTTGDEGARSVFALFSDLVQEVPCEGSSGDIDTLEDLERMSLELRKNH
ncbi:MAG: nucleotidyltransferase family protein [Ilumatobacteraceae bacterium]